MREDGFEIDIDTYLNKCVRCGQCRSICPVFEEIRQETASPRAKVFLTSLMRRGEIKASAPAAELLSQCLQCRRCTHECPSGLPVHKAVTAGRRMLRESNPLRLNNKIYPGLFQNPCILNLTANMGRGIRTLLSPLPFTNRHLSSLSSGSALSKLRIITRPQVNKPLARVGYFLGCATNHLFPSVAQSTVSVLTGLGCEVVIPRRLNCCGMPHLGEGDAGTAAEMIKRNIGLFNKHGAEVIIFDCASCYITFRDHVRALNWEGNNGPDGYHVDEKQLYEVTDFITGRLDYKNKLRPLSEVIATIHDPCHLTGNRDLYLTDAHRRLLRNIPGIIFKETPGPRRCCGGGGIFALKQNRLSEGILARKAEQLSLTGAGIVTTLCPSCLHQLSKLKQRPGGNGATPLHAIQLLARSLGLS